MLPKKIHYCWFGGRDMPALSNRCLESWCRVMPDYELVLWNESNVKLDHPLAESRLNRKQWAFLSDYIRLQVLFDEGGIYLDTDIEVVRPFDELIEYECIIGEELPGRPNLAVLGASKGHPYIKACLDLMKDNFSRQGPVMIAPEIAMKALELCPDGVKVFPKEAFYPFNPYDITNEVKVLMYSDVTEQTYAIHHWAKGWVIPLHERIRRKVVGSIKSIL